MKWANWSLGIGGTEGVGVGGCEWVGCVAKFEGNKG